MTERVGIEIGGTFTDLVWASSDGSLQTGKVPSTPGAVQEAVLHVIADAKVKVEDVDQITHGSTVATNSLLTRRGAQAALITTAGFRDVIEIGTHDRTGNIYNILYEKPSSPIPRKLIREVQERVDANGSVLEPLDLDKAWIEVEALIAAGVEAIAVCLLHAYRNPAHEKALVGMIRARAPQIVAFASHEVSPEFREYERTMTTAVNAFVGPVVERYVGKLAKELGNSGYAGVLRIMQSNGGTMPAAVAGDNAVRMLLSGPAAGVSAAVWYARRNDIRDIITLDMGGTSTDVAIAPGLVPRIVSDLLVDNLPIRTATVDMATIGAGGGSIASVDEGGFLSVGPQSAGAVPGPACYGRGGDRPTVTDSQVIAGILRPAQFFGGKMTLNIENAERALASLGQKGGSTGAADSILRMVNSSMAGAVRMVSTARGIDPRDFTLVAYGGGGPLHSAQVAEEIGIRRVLVPWSPGLTSAFGLLIADTIIDVAQSDLQMLSDTTLNADVVARLLSVCARIAEENGLEAKPYEVNISLDMRYRGQAFELPIRTSGKTTGASELRRLFEDEHILRYGYARRSLPVEVVGYRLQVVHRAEGRVVPPVPVGGPKNLEHVEVTISGQRVTASFLARECLAPGEVFEGPAVIEEATTTTLVPPGWLARCLPTGDLLLEYLK